MSAGLQQQYTEIVRTSLLKIGDLAIQAQAAISPPELDFLETLDAAQLLLDAERALKNTRIAAQKVSEALKKCHPERRPSE